MILIVSLDPSKDIMEQLHRVAQEHDLSSVEVVGAWRNQQCFNGTEPSLNSNVYFDIKKIEIKPDFDETEIKPQHSYKAVQERNKFFNRKHR